MKLNSSVIATARRVHVVAPGARPLSHTRASTAKSPAFANYGLAWSGQARHPGLSSGSPHGSCLGSGPRAFANAASDGERSSQQTLLRREPDTFVPSVVHHSAIRHPHFDKILIANRGEIACRVIRTARKLGIKTVAVYSEADSDSLHTKLADEAYCIGPAPSGESYLRMDKVIEVCKRSEAQAVHPGYGFLSENAEFAERLADAGIVFIGPPAQAIVSMGSKSESKNIMSAAGVPCVPGYHGDDQDPDYLLSRAKEIGFPVLIKAIHGGGGKGMRTVESSSIFYDALASAKRESLKAFGNDTVLIEKFIVRPRHIEVQIFADAHGNVVSLWERDCSVQRRNQKILEEAPAPGLSPDLRADLSAKAVAAARAVHYVGAGTVEFIFDNDTQDFYFMEMNTRLQVEHPVTEMVTGLDLVEWQLEVAAGNVLPLSQSAIPLVGHAFEARIYAGIIPENPRNDFLPDSGSLLYLSTPSPTHVFAPALPLRDASSLSPSSGDETEAMRIVPILGSQAPSVRLEQGFLQGSQIGVFYDPMIAKLVVHGRDRAEALRVLRGALDEYHVAGLSTNVEFLRSLAGNEAFIDGDLETGFIKKHQAELLPPLTQPSAELLTQAALFVTLRDMLPRTATSAPSPWTTLAARRFNGRHHEGVVNIRTEDESTASITVHLKHLGSGSFTATVRQGLTSDLVTVQSARLSSPTVLDVTVNGASSHSTIVSQRPPASVPVSDAPHTQERLHIFHDGRKTTLVLPPPKWLLSLGSDVLEAGKAKGALKAPMPSLVVEVKVTVGDKVAAGDPVVIIESMKTETVLRAPKGGVVNAVGCSKGEMVEEGRQLIDITVDESNTD
ncbi:hypothetical protein PUNSTDRAFT_59595 [Punctularia strigosozonata HHB-11173 SS5]|uniref:uncharacterized protein n=1 Tax=Punctularia strigosozonata (strain HHB-11173) TaxID=741275 RepID=UPI0004417C25|nr:uncharacterized protein PUNSTDRAFT_59595 [Punctularia strigosozonata HHB-11173 SS5]EIN14234.1 hypothetical protein PUNSTDRAFT_59595 [Punctularia strigosozonata HHB-11173 SS5]